MSAPEASQKDFERWLNIATEDCQAIVKIPVENNPTGGQNYSLETSLGHFTSIQLELVKLLKLGGGVHTENVQLDPAANGKEAVISEVDAEVSNEVDNVVMENVSSEVGDGSRADDPTIKWIEISSALECRIKKS